MKKIRNTLLLCTGIAVVVWAIDVNLKRATIERRNTAVEICLEASQTADLCLEYGKTFPDFLAECRKEGCSAVALGEEKLGTLASEGMVSFDGPAIIVHNDEAGRTLAHQMSVRYHIAYHYEKSGGKTKIVPEFPDIGAPSFWNRDLPVGFSEAKMRFYSARGFRIFLRPENAGDIQWLTERCAAPAAGCIVDGKEVPGYPGKERAFSDKIRKEGLLLVPVEFTTPAGIETLKREAAGNLVQGHTILQQELDRNAADGPWLNRWVRAVRERGHRFLLVRLWNNKDPKENLLYLGELRAVLESSGYSVSRASLPGYPAPGRREARLLAALLCGLLFPLGGLYLFRRPGNWLLTYFLINGVTLAGGLIISALFFDVDFMQRVITVPGVKILMALPLAASAAVLFSREEFTSLWNTKITVKHAAIAFLAGAVLAVLLIRSGNTGTGWLHPDKGFREFLENVFVVRPRTKECLVGQPLLLLGLYLGNPVLIWGGMIGQISIINTFFHAHTPVAISFIRTLIGIVTGAILGAVPVMVLALREKAQRRQ